MIHIKSWHRILDAICDFETSMGGGNQSNGRDLLSRNPNYIKPTVIRMQHLRKFYMEVRYAALVFGVEMSDEATTRVLESLKESFDRIQALK